MVSLIGNKMDDVGKAKNLIAHYTGIGLALGTAFGAAFNNVGLGVALGLAIGAAIGTSQTAEHEKDDPEEEL